MGGRFNFLYCKDVEELLHARESLDAMEVELNGRGWSDVTADHEAVVELLVDLEQAISAVQKAVDRLKPVWKAVENDRGAVEMEHVIEKYRKGQA